MLYSEVKDRVMQSIGAVSGELDTEVAQFVLDALQDIHAEGPWPWNRDSTTFVARAVFSGTCEFTIGGTDIILNTGRPASQAACNRYAGGMIELDGGNVYEIGPSVVSGSEDFVFDTPSSEATVTVETTIIDATKATGLGTYQIAQDQTSMPAEVEEIIQVVDHLNDTVLIGIPYQARRRFYPNPFQGVGAFPSQWWSRGVDTSGNVQIGVYPFPSSDRAYFIEYWKRPVLPTADGDDIQAVTGIPSRFHPIIVARAKEKAFEFEDESQVKRSLAAHEYIRGIDKMKSHARPDPGAIRQMRSWRNMSYNMDYDDHVEITGY